MLEMKYFVLRPGKDDWHGKASRAAIRAYADALDKMEEEPELVYDLREWVKSLSK